MCPVCAASATWVAGGVVMSGLAVLGVKVSRKSKKAKRRNPKNAANKEE